MSAAFRSLKLAKASPAARVAPRSAPVLQQRTIAMTAPRLRNPSDNRRGSEGTMAGSGSVDEIAHSEGAFSDNQTRPDQAGAQIEKEQPGVSMQSSAASNENAERSSAMKDSSKRGKVSSADGTNPPPSHENLGGSKARKDSGKGR